MTNEITGRLADGKAVRVSIDGDLIAAVEELTGSVGSDLPWILPGLVDAQVNGYKGFDVNAGKLDTSDLTTDIVHDLVSAELEQGVTTFCPTVITAPQDKIVHVLETIAEARAKDPLIRASIPGVHIEGPYLSQKDGPRGAHDKDHIHDPDPKEFEEWLTASNGTPISIVTLAPERTGAIDYIRRITAEGIIAAIGHTDAKPEEISAAVNAGATLSTHLGNGRRAVESRDRNNFWEQLGNGRLMAGVIADGHHLSDAKLVSMIRAKGVANTFMVSDSVALAGMPPGDYDTPVGGLVTVHAGDHAEVTGSKITLPDNPDLLAGSGVSLADCVRFAHLGAPKLDLQDVMAMASTNPAQLLGVPDRGLIEPGAVADLAIFRPDLTVIGTVARGELVHGDRNLIALSSEALIARTLPRQTLRTERNESRAEEPTSGTDRRPSGTPPPEAQSER